MSEAAARRIALRAAGLTPADVDGSKIVLAVIQVPDPNAAPQARVPSSRTIARRREQVDAAARAASAALALRGQVQRAYRPPPGKVFGVDAAGMLLIGPAGALGTTSRVAATLAPLAAGGRHPAAVLMEAGGWADEGALCKALAALAPKLAAIGVRICRRKAGLRAARIK